MQVKENFCGACLTIPLAFAGAGTAFGSDRQQTIRKWAVIATVVSVLLTVYFVYVRKCKSCTISR
jgi:hypothetical protein